jgi:hypothetical protein
VEKALPLAVAFAVVVLAGVGYVALRSPTGETRAVEGARSSSEAPASGAKPSAELVGEKPENRARPMAAPPAKPKTEATEVEGWAAKYASASSAVLLAQRQALDDGLQRLSKPELDKRLAAGQFEIVGEGRTYHGQRADDDLIFEVVMQLDTNDTRKVTLPQNEFPEMYAMKREMSWIQNRVDELDRKAVLQTRERDQ